MSDVDRAPTEQEAYIRNGIRAFVAASYGMSFKKGWWTDKKTGESTLLNPLVFSNKIALIHSEVSEALEGDRRSKMDEHLPHRKSAEVELADAMIRIADLAGAFGYDLGGAIIEKMAYNDVRKDHYMSERQKDGGKAY